jgi:hypothetical protein
MAKVKRERIVMSGAEKKELDFMLDINVTAGGLFTALLPPNVVELFEIRGVDLKSNKRRGSRPGYYEANTMDALLKLVDADCKKYVSRKLISKRMVIEYQVETTCSYVFTKSGDIGPNGYYAHNHDKLGDRIWMHGTKDIHANTREPYGMQVYVKPKIELTYQYLGGVKKIEYAYAHETYAFGMEEVSGNLKWLNDVVGIGPISGNTIIIEYTEQIAEFFVRFIKTICLFNEHIKNVLTPDAIREIAANSTPLFLLPSDSNVSTNEKPK